MGIQINGNTNNINAGIGSLSIEDLNELDIVGVATAANFKTGVSNLHSLGLTLSGGQLDVGSNIKVGTAGVITATTFVGNLTGTATRVSLAAQSFDTDCYPVFALDATGNQTLHTKSNRLSFNSSTGALSATSFVGDGSNLTGISAGTSLSGSTNNTVCTVTGANAIQGETKLTFDSTTTQLKITRDDDSNSGFYVFHNDGSECARLVNKGTGHEGALLLQDGGTPTVYFDGETGSRSYINTGAGLAIGTQNLVSGRPDNVLHLHKASSGTADGPTIYFTNQQTGVTGSDGFTVGINDALSPYLWNRENTAVSIGTNNAERLRITSDGNLIIGHTSGSNKLQIGNTGHSGYCIAANSPSYGAVIQVGDGATPGTAAALWIRNLNNGGGTTACFRVQGDGTAHFGDQTSTGKYNDGNTGCSWYDAKDSWQQAQSGTLGWSMMYFNKIGGTGVDNRIMQFNSSGSNIGYINRNGGNTQFATSSDYRLKKDIVALPNGLERVKQLRPVAFKWIADNSDMEGFVAHEAQEICPYAVTGKKDEVATEDNGDRKKGDMIVQAVDYGEFTPLLTAAMQELIAKVETLEAKVAALEGS